VAGLWVACFDSSFFAAPDFAAALFGRDRVAGSAWLADPGADLAFAERLLVRARGVAAVGPQLAGLDAGRCERV